MRAPAQLLPPAAVCALALWQLVAGSPLAAVPAPGLWRWLARLGAGDAFAHLLPVLAAGGVAAALTQPLAHGMRVRPWAEGVAAALLVAGLLLPVPVGALFAALPFLLLARDRASVALLAMAVAVPPCGVPAIGFALWRMGTRLRLPACANDNQPGARRAH